MSITEGLTVDFSEQRSRFTAPNPMGQSQPDPGTPPNPAAVLTNAVTAAAWTALATAGQKACYSAALWVYEQIEGSSRAAIKAALGL